MVDSRKEEGSGDESDNADSFIPLHDIDVFETCDWPPTSLKGMAFSDTFLQ